jgi:hypothetical protein
MFHVEQFRFVLGIGMCLVRADLTAAPAIHL